MRRPGHRDWRKDLRSAFLYVALSYIHKSICLCSMICMYVLFSFHVNILSTFFILVYRNPISQLCLEIPPQKPWMEDLVQQDLETVEEILAWLLHQKWWVGQHLLHRLSKIIKQDLWTFVRKTWKRWVFCGMKFKKYILNKVTVCSCNTISS